MEWHSESYRRNPMIAKTTEFVGALLVLAGLFGFIAAGAMGMHLGGVNKS